MADPRKVEVMADPDSFADKLRKRRKYMEEEDVEGLQQTTMSMQGKDEAERKKKKKDEY